MSEETVISAEPTEPPQVPFAEFLESHPPNQRSHISNISQWYPRIPTGGYYVLATPEIQLHCSSDSCNGIRFFRCISPAPRITSNRFDYTFLTYRCWNCQKTEKVFALATLGKGDKDHGEAVKFGESPPFGPPTSARLIKLIGPDRDTFLKGRRSEDQALGIGAFIYYRRVVENQKNRILEEIIKVAERVGAPTDALKTALIENQFSKGPRLV